jgi:hypothetical protein
MRRLSKQFICLLRSSLFRLRRHRAPGERGIAFLVLMMVLTALLIGLTVSLPDIYTQGQRAREEELLFRGDQYARAILLYHRQFNKFPQTVDDLIKKTNGYRFLRHAYRDPMTRSGKWRFIHANAAGVVIDSKTLTPPKPKKPGEGGSAAGAPSGTGSESQNQGQGSDRNAPGQTNAPQDQPQQGTGATDNEVKGAFIVGVASTSTRKSIRIWNSKERYDLWEFLGVATAAVPGSSGAPANPGPQGTQGTGQPTGNPNPTNQ